MPADPLLEKVLHIKPPLIAGGLLLLAALLHFALPIWSFLDLRIVDVGVMIIGAGAGLMLWAFLLFKKHGNSILPTAPRASVLLRKGPYTFTRNPMYLGIALILLGIAFLMGTLPFFVAAGLFHTAVDRVHIPYEEFKLENQFGEAYRSYTARTRRWI